MSQEVSRNQTAANHTFRGGEGLRQAQAELMDLLETVRLSSNPEVELSKVLKDIKRINLPSSELDDYLTATLNAAVECQARVIKMATEEHSNEDLSNSQAVADLISLLAVHTGIENKAIAVKNGNMSGMDYKVEQIRHYSDHYAAHDNYVHSKAVQRIVEVGFDLNANPSSRRQKIMAQVAGIAVLSAVLMNNNVDTSFADDSAANTSPTKPTDKDGSLQPGNVVKIIKSNKNAAVEAEKVTPVQSEPQNLPKKIVSVKKKDPVEAAATLSSSNENKSQVKNPVVTVRKTERQSVKINTVPLNDQKDGKKNYVRIIPPVPSAPPATVQETAPTPAPTPEQQNGPYVLNAEQNAIIDSLNLSPAKKDFLRQATAGAIGLQQHGSKVNPEVVIAQAVLESGWGQSELTKQANNYFGMKAGTDWKGKTLSMLTEEVKGGQRITENAVWPVFESAEDCFAEYAKFIEKLPHFADALAYSNDPAKYVGALVNGPLKYATDPEYEAKIMGTIRANRLSEVVGIAHKLQTEKAAADAAAEAQRAAAAKVAEEEATKRAQTISQPKNKELGPVTVLHKPVPEGSGISPQYAGHKGIDFAVAAGTPFYAAMGGTVEVRKFDVTDKQFCKDAFANLGRSVNEIKPEDRVQQEVRITRVIDGRTYVTIYAHMDRIDVETGQIVEAGEALGITGNTGCSTGDHAHFEMQVDNMGSVAPNLLFDGEKWKAPSSIGPWSVSIKPQSAEADHDHTEEGHVHVQSADISNDAGMLKIDHSTEPAEISGSATANDADDKALKEESPQIQNNASVEQTVSQAIEEARRAAEISSAALERARSNDKALVK
jgi:flagellum-specific peptidoglycan hydrolase FlgJ